MQSVCLKNKSGRMIECFVYFLAPAIIKSTLDCHHVDARQRDDCDWKNIYFTLRSIRWADEENTPQVVCVGSARKNNSLQCCTCTYDRLEIILFMRFEFNFETHAEALSQSSRPTNNTELPTTRIVAIITEYTQFACIHMYVHISHNSDTTIANPPTYQPL